MRIGYTALISLALLGCSSTDSLSATMPDRTGEACGEKPNCVTTIDPRDDFLLAPFELSHEGRKSWQGIKEIALSLPGASLGQQGDNYLRVECRSKIFRFVDDFEVRLAGEQLIVRSESRVGYSDFGVNRKRSELFRQKLITAGYLTH